MSSREEHEGRWSANPEAATASGGHMTPEVSPVESWVDPLSAPLPSETEEARRGAWPNESPRPPSATDVFPETERRRSLRDRGMPAGSRRRKVGVRRVKRTIKHVDPLTVLKLSAFYWGVLLLLWLLVVAVIYNLVEARGVFNTIEELYKDFAIGGEKPDISLLFVERWAFLIGFIFGLLGTVMNVFLAFLYNVAADTIGGLELTFVERDG